MMAPSMRGLLAFGLLVLLKCSLVEGYPVYPDPGPKGCGGCGHNVLNEKACQNTTRYYVQSCRYGWWFRRSCTTRTRYKLGSPWCCSGYTLYTQYSQYVCLNRQDCTRISCVYGDCKDHVNGYWCDCGAGYTGKQCHININECGSSPCQNGGSCIDLVNSYQCVCPQGYSGAQCQIEPIPEAITTDTSTSPTSASTLAPAPAPTPAPEPGTEPCYGPWTSFDSCSRSCDIGLQTRIRECLCGLSCTLESLIDLRVCNSNHCPEKNYEVDEGFVVKFEQVTEVDYLKEENEIKITILHTINAYSKLNLEELCEALKLKPLVDADITETTFGDNDISVASGYPRLAETDSKLESKFILQAQPQDMDGVCQQSSRSRRDIKRRDTTTEYVYVDREFLHNALTGINNTIGDLFDLDVPVEVYFPDILDPNSSAKPQHGLTIAIAVPAIIVILVIIIAVPLVLKSRKPVNPEKKAGKDETDGKVNKDSSNDAHEEDGSPQMKGDAPRKEEDGQIETIVDNSPEDLSPRPGTCDDVKLAWAP